MSRLLFSKFSFWNTKTCFPVLILYFLFSIEIFSLSSSIFGQSIFSHKLIKTRKRHGKLYVLSPQRNIWKGMSTFSILYPHWDEDRCDSSLWSSFSLDRKSCWREGRTKGRTKGKQEVWKTTKHKRWEKRSLRFMSVFIFDFDLSLSDSSQLLSNTIHVCNLGLVSSLVRLEELFFFISSPSTRQNVTCLSSYPTRQLLSSLVVEQ